MNRIVLGSHFGIMLTVIGLTVLFLACRRKSVEPEIKILIGLAILYPFGKFTQAYFWFPAAIRWHLADIGWVPSFTVFASAIFIGFCDIKKRHPEVKEIRKVALIACFGSAILALWVESLTTGGSAAAKTKSGAAGDPIDCILYVFMSYVCWRLVTTAYRKMITNPYWSK